MNTFDVPTAELFLQKRIFYVKFIFDFFERTFLFIFLKGIQNFQIQNFFVVILKHLEMKDTLILPIVQVFLLDFEPYTVCNLFNNDSLVSLLKNRYLQTSQTSISDYYFQIKTQNALILPILQFFLLDFEPYALSNLFKNG